MFVGARTHNCDSVTVLWVHFPIEAKYLLSTMSRLGWGLINILQNRYRRKGVVSVRLPIHAI